MTPRTALVLAAGLVVTAGCEGLSTLDVSDCSGAATYTLGTSVAGKVGDDDCKDSEGHVGDAYQFTLTEQTMFSIQVSPGQEVALFVGTLTGTSVPVDIGGEPHDGTIYILPAGQYLATVSGSKGDYTFRAVTAAAPSDCVEVYTVRGMSTAGSITPADCPGGIATVRQDIYALRLKTGQSIAVNGSRNKPGHFAIYTGEGKEQVSKPIDMPQGGSVQFSYTAKFDGEHRVHVLCEPMRFGNCAYTLSIQ
jgi:hypothetical protein